MFGVNPFGWPYFAQGPARVQSTPPSGTSITDVQTILGQNISMAQPQISPAIGTSGMTTP